MIKEIIKLFFKSLPLLVSLYIIGACSAQLYKLNATGGKPAQAQSIIQTSITRTPRPTETLVPSATVDYLQTADVAQATADEARRINAQATAQHEEIVNQQLLATQAVEQQNFMREQWTAVAANTVIPLTATQQAVMNTMVPMQQQVMAGILTATKEAPTQAAAMARAANEKEFGARISLAQVVLMFSLSLFIIFEIVRLGVNWYRDDHKPQQPEPVAETPKETVIQMRTDKGRGNFSQQRIVVPCTPEQFTIFAEALTQGEKSMAINQWDKKETGLGRPVILRIRNWARMERETPFVLVTEDDQLVPTDEFLELMMRWLDGQALPVGYEFEPDALQAAPTAPTTLNPEIMGNLA